MQLNITGHTSLKEKLYTTIILGYDAERMRFWSVPHVFNWGVEIVFASNAYIIIFNIAIRMKFRTRFYLYNNTQLFMLLLVICF